MSCVAVRAGCKIQIDVGRLGVCRVSVWNGAVGYRVCEGCWKSAACRGKNRFRIRSILKTCMCLTCSPASWRHLISIHSEVNLSGCAPLDTPGECTCLGAIEACVCVCVLVPPPSFYVLSNKKPSCNINSYYKQR